jgi:hypothetical protein
MNTIIKHLIKIGMGFMLLSLVQNGFSQHIQRSMEKPAYDRTRVQQMINGQLSGMDTVWLPVRILAFAGENQELLYAYDFYEYHQNGLLKKLTYSYIASTETLPALTIYHVNNIYTDPLMDMVDTIATYIRDTVTGEHRPYERTYYNYEHYADEQSFWEEYNQVWDEQYQQWKTTSRYYIHQLDTACVSEFQDCIERFDGDGNQTSGQKATLTFDEQGNVSESMQFSYNGETNSYQESTKTAYFYDEDNICYELHTYHLKNEQWQLHGKRTDMKWKEFYGFDNGDVLFFNREHGVYPDSSPKNKNKIIFANNWADENFFTNYPPLWENNSYVKFEWGNNPFYVVDSSFLFPPVWCLAVSNYYYLDEHGNWLKRAWRYYDYYTCSTDSVLDLFHDFTNFYDSRGRLYQYKYRQELLMYDTTHITWTSYAIDSFTYVLRPVNIDELQKSEQTLTIIPNPGSDTVKIIASDNMNHISLYASDGRMVLDRSVFGKEAIINISHLTKGIYVVRATLQNGAVQNGKLVVQ